MKVCMLTTGFPRFEGDLFGTFVFEQARALAAIQIGVEVLAPHDRGACRNETKDGVGIRRFRYLYPASWQRLAYGGGIPTNLKQSWLARLQVPLFLVAFWWAARRRMGGADLVHCHWTVTGLVARWAAGRRPVVLSVRGSDINLMQRGVAAWVNRRIYQRVDRVVAVSEDIANKLAQAGVEPKKIRVVGNGVDGRFKPMDQAWARQQLGLPAVGPIVLFVGLLVPVKGLEVLYQALQSLGQQAPFCALVGQGPLGKKLAQQAAADGLSDQFLFAGRQPSDQVPLWLNGADMLVLPSFSEGRPNAVLEAQACGRPVVATAVGGVPELICHNKSGLLVQPGNAAELAAGIRKILVQPKFARRLACGGRQAVSAAGLTWEANARQMQKIYSELSGSRQQLGQAV